MKKNQNNIACRIYKEQINLINQLPENEKMIVLYISINQAFNQFENQNENQNENQFDNAYISVSVSVYDSLSELSKSILDLLSKNLVAKEFSANYGGNRQGSGRPVANPVKEKVKGSEDKKQKNTKKELSLDFVREDFKDILIKWCKYKKLTLKEQYRVQYDKILKISNESSSLADKIVEQSIGEGWKGLFELKTNKPEKKKHWRELLAEEKARKEKENAN